MERPFVELIDIQEEIGCRLEGIECWVRVEIESHSESRGHHYLGLIQKAERGAIVAKARGVIWAFRAGILEDFRLAAGKSLAAGMSVVVKAEVDFHPVYGLSLNISDIDTTFATGEREKEKQRTIKRLTDEGLMDRQKSLTLPILPSRMAVISSSTAAGYGDFCRQLETNARAFRFNYDLIPSLMQGEQAPQSIAKGIELAAAQGIYDLILVFRGGGAESDLYCYDEYDMAYAIATCPVPVLTAIGHERDFHIADMVAYEHFKTPTALAVHLIDWYSEVEDTVNDALDGILTAAREAAARVDAETRRCLDNIRFALGAAITKMEGAVRLAEAGIKASDPRAILSQGYVLAVGSDGTVLKSATSKQAGDDFSLRFSDGLWRCLINETKTNDDK